MAMVPTSSTFPAAGRVEVTLARGKLYDKRAALRSGNQTAGQGPVRSGTRAGVGREDRRRMAGQYGVPELSQRRWRSGWRAATASCCSTCASLTGTGCPGWRGAGGSGRRADPRGRQPCLRKRGPGGRPSCSFATTASAAQVGRGCCKWLDEGQPHGQPSTPTPARWTRILGSISRGGSDSDLKNRFTAGGGSRSAGCRPLPESRRRCLCG